ncbi:hypothetical protein PTKIN_Ptkin01aG0382700 [Pterospermum kingtungense]
MSAANLPGKWTRKCAKTLLDVTLVLSFFSSTSSTLFFVLHTSYSMSSSKVKPVLHVIVETREREMEGFVVVKRRSCLRLCMGGEMCSGKWGFLVLQENGNMGRKKMVMVELEEGWMKKVSTAEPAENVIFLHGFQSSSSFWTETVFENLFVSGHVKDHYRLFAVDLLEFGRSPKPNNSIYTSDHVEMIEESVISPFQLSSFHLVAHSMGCIIGLALAAKYSKVKDGTSTAMVPNALAGKTLWPPIAFGRSVMSWELNFMEVDLTRHTHHSAWHCMHNVICGGAKFMDEYLEILKRSRL